MSPPRGTWRAAWAGPLLMAAWLVGCGGSGAGDAAASSGVLTVATQAPGGSIPEHVRSLVAAYDADPVAFAAGGTPFPVPAGRADTVRLAPGLEARTLVAWGDTLVATAAGPRFGAGADLVRWFGDPGEVPADGLGPAPSWVGRSDAGWLYVHHEALAGVPPGLGAVPTADHARLAERLGGSLASAAPGAEDLRGYRRAWKEAVGASWLRVERDARTGALAVAPSTAARRWDATDGSRFRLTGLDAPPPDHDDAGGPLGPGEVVGTFALCSGCTTPWGTVLGGEENVAFAYGDLEPFDSEQRLRPGRGFDAGAPVALPVAPEVGGAWSSADGDAHRRDTSGWLVEIDPTRPAGEAYASTLAGGSGRGHRKVGALGRARWEGASVHVGGDERLVVGQPLVLYAGDDRPGGRLHRFVSTGLVEAGMDAAALRALLDDGYVEVAHLEDLDEASDWRRADGADPTDPDGTAPVRGTGRWIRLSVGNGAQVAPNAGTSNASNPSVTLLPAATTVGAALADATHNGLGAFPDDDAVRRALFTAATKLGVRELSRPEATLWHPGGYGAHGPLLFVALTGHTRPRALLAGGVLNTDRVSGALVDSTPNGDGVGRLLVVREADPGNPAAGTTFSWWIAWSGAPGLGAFQAARPDNLLRDAAGGVWFTTDGQPEVGGGDDALYYLDLDPGHAQAFGRAFRVAAMPRGSEPTGPCLTPDGTSLLLSVQHPPADARLPRR